MREEWNSFRDKLPSNDRFYAAGLVDQAVASSDIGATADRLIMVPFISPVRSRLAEIGICKTTAGAGPHPIRLGVYQAGSRENLLPTHLLFDSGQIDSNLSAFYNAFPDIVVDEGVLYYVAFVKQGAAAGSGWAHFASRTWAVFGYDRPTTSVLAAVVCQLRDGVTGALPDPVTVTGGLTTGSQIPMLLCRYTKV